MPFDTQRRAGSPDEVNLGPSVIEALISNTPLSWILPIYGVISPITIDTDSLCATLPGLPEHWGVDDMIWAVDTAHHPELTAKLIRMAKASIWGEYCEFVPVGAVVELPRLVATDAYTAEIWGPSYFGYTLAQTIPDVDFWALWVRCEEPATTGSPPRLRGGDGTGTDPVLGSWPNNVGEERTTVIAVGSTWPNPAGSGPPVGFTPSGTWHISLDAGEGRWGFSISAWNLDGRETPPAVDPWPLAPVNPVAYQFTDECATALCSMADQWPAHRIGGALLPGMLTEILDAVNAAAPLPPGVEASGTVALVGGGQIIDIPPEAVGCTLDLAIPTLLSSAGSSPTVYWSAGYVGIGTDRGWYPSTRLKHDPQLVYPFPPLATFIGVDLEPRVTGSLTWLVPIITP